MGFTIENKHLIKCLRVSSNNKYLILTLIECLITPKHALELLYKSKHFPRIYNRKREWVFFSEHSVRTRKGLRNNSWVQLRSTSRCMLIRPPGTAVPDGLIFCP